MFHCGTTSLQYSSAVGSGNYCELRLMLVLTKIQLLCHITTILSYQIHIGGAIGLRCI